MLNDYRGTSYDLPRASRRSARHRLATPQAAAAARTERGGAIQALTHDVLVSRSLQVSSSSFITIISIIQGVALALLAQNTFEKPSALGYLQSFTMLLVLVTVFYFYLSISILLRWAPSFMDAFLPFGIAGLEIPPAFFLGDAVAWNAWLGVFWIFTAGGLHTTIKWSPLSHFGRDREAHGMLHEWLGELRLITAIGGLALVATGLIASRQGEIQAWWGTVGVIVTLAIVSSVVARTEIRLSQIHEHFGVNRPPFN